MRPALLALIAVLGACSINHRSDQLACVSNNDCGPSGRCEDNVCTNPNGGFDAPEPTSCPEQCTSCDLGTKSCIVDCADGSVDCTKKITCPPGFHCDIRCSGRDQCRASVDCMMSASCAVECSGPSSCRNIACGAGPCEIACTGDQSCRSIVCGNSCKCDVGCSEEAGCAEVVCQNDGCETFGGGCSSQFFGCSEPCF